MAQIEMSRFISGAAHFRTHFLLWAPLAGSFGQPAKPARQLAAGDLRHCAAGRNSRFAALRRRQPAEVARVRSSSNGSTRQFSLGAGFSRRADGQVRRSAANHHRRQQGRSAGRIRLPKGVAGLPRRRQRFLQNIPQVTGAQNVRSTGARSFRVCGSVRLCALALGVHDSLRAQWYNDASGIDRSNHRNLSGSRLIGRPGETTCRREIQLNPLPTPPQCGATASRSKNSCNFGCERWALRGESSSRTARQMCPNCSMLTACRLAIGAA